MNKQSISLIAAAYLSTFSTCEKKFLICRRVFVATIKKKRGEMKSKYFNRKQRLPLSRFIFAIKDN